MCLACEQDAIWLAYLERQGLLQPDDPAAIDALFGAFPVQPLPLQTEAGEQKIAGKDNNDNNKQKKNPFSCDDPTAG